MIKNQSFLVFVLLPFVCFGREYPQPSNVLTPTEKIYMLSKFWQEANYNFAFFGENISRADWNKAYRNYIGLVLESQDDYDFYVLLRKFCGLLGDGHTNVYRPPIKSLKGPEKPGDVYIPTSEGRRFEEGFLRVCEIEGKLIVYFIDRELGNKIPLKSRIIKVNGIPVEQYLTENVLPQYGGSPHSIRSNAVDNLLSGKLGTRYDVAIIRPDGNEAAISLTLGELNMENLEFDCMPYFDEFPDSMFDFEKTLNLTWPEKGIARLEVNSFSDDNILDRFKELLPELRKARGLILDIRYNGGGSTSNGTDILEYLTRDDSLYGMRTKTRMHIARNKAWGQYDKDTESRDYKMARDNYYKESPSYGHAVKPRVEERVIVPTVILTGNSTASAAEDFLVYADNQKHMIRIGQKTCGSTGQPLLVDLGRGFSARICTKNDMFADGRKFVGLGIVPHIEVEMTMEDYEDTKDVTLLRALEYLNRELE